MPIKNRFLKSFCVGIFNGEWSLFRNQHNFAIWDFSLTEKEMAQISSLDLGYVGESVKHFNPEFVRGCLAVKIHD